MKKNNASRQSPENNELIKSFDPYAVVQRPKCNSEEC